MVTRWFQYQKLNSLPNLNYTLNQSRYIDYNWANNFKNEKLSYELFFKPGNPVDVILNASEEKNIDLLIIGAAKREKLFTYYVGSIARKITRKAKCCL